jgi:Flp pilus assembly protein TadD
VIIRTGVALQAAGNIAKAMQHFRKAIEIDRANSEAHNYFGAAFVAQRYVREAIQEFRTAVRLKTNYPEAHVNLAQALLGESSSDQEAGHEFRTVLKLRQASTSLPRTSSGLGIVLAEQGDLLGTVEEFRAALTLDPNSTESRKNFGLALAQVGNSEEAVQPQQSCSTGAAPTPGTIHRGNLLAQAGRQWRIPCLHCRA